MIFVRVKYRDTSTKMNLDTMLDQIFPTQDKYREITRDIINLFIEQSREASGQKQLEVKSIVSKLEEKGHNRHTAYKVLREHLVPIGLVKWKKFEGSIQLSNRFANSLRRFSISWKNFVKKVKQGDKEPAD